MLNEGLPGQRKLPGNRRKSIGFAQVSPQITPWPIEK
jgi:hypothetical protein